MVDVFPREREVDLSNEKLAAAGSTAVFPREREVDLSMLGWIYQIRKLPSSLVRGKWI